MADMRAASRWSPLNPTASFPALPAAVGHGRHRHPLEPPRSGDGFRAAQKRVPRAACPAAPV
jgi:hypothetical protein